VGAAVQVPGNRLDLKLDRKLDLKDAWEIMLPMGGSNSPANPFPSEVLVNERNVRAILPWRVSAATPTARLVYTR
jgi:hypothetical protein